MGRGHPVLEAGGVSWPEISEPWSLVRLQDGGGLDSVLGSLRCAPDPPEGEAPSRPVDQLPQGAS